MGISTGDEASAKPQLRSAHILGPLQSVTGLSGQQYTVEEVLQDRGAALGAVMKARAGPKQVILKSIPEDYDFRLALYAQTRGCRNVRALNDTIPSHRMFVFDYLNDNLLHLAVRQDYSSQKLKTILKSALNGLAALHERNIVHTDLKANNIMIQHSGEAGNLQIDKVEVIDLEDAIKLSPEQFLEGAHLGNIMWRSPEANAMGPMSTPSDMFSFGIICVYAMAKILPFKIDQSSLAEDDDPLSVVIERQISYFADQEGFDGLMRHLNGKDDWVQIFEITKSWFGKEKPRKPFALWQGMHVEHEEAFKDLVGGLTNFDPARRLTAQQALEHEWFRDVSSV